MASSVGSLYLSIYLSVWRVHILHWASSRAEWFASGPVQKIRLNHQKKFLGHQIGNSGKPDKTCVKTFLLMATGKL